MANIHTISEAKRGCGYRKPGGLYMMGGGVALPCCKLPFELTVCPCCGAGIKFSRGFTWIHSKVFGTEKCINENKFCPLQMDGLRMGLLWVGEVYYKTTERFNREADTMGISRRIARVPNGFEVGKTWIALAHIRAIVRYSEGGEPQFFPAIFRLFKPDRIEYVLTGTETEDELEALEKRGLPLVRIFHREMTEQEMQFDDEPIDDDRPE